MFSFFSSTPCILCIGRARGRFSFWLIIWYWKNTDSFVLSDNLFALNYSFIFCSSKTALVKKVLMLLSETNRFVSLANMWPKALETLLRSSMYKINSNGARINPWGTPHVISWDDIFSLLLIITHSFQLLR